MNRLAVAFLVAAALCLVGGAAMLSPVAALFTAGGLFATAGVALLEVRQR